MNTNRASTHLLPVEHHVISQRARFERFRVQQCKVVGIGRGEWMVHRDQPLLLVAIIEQWEVDHPQELERALVAQIELRAELQTHVAEQRTYFAARPRDHQQRIANPETARFDGALTLLVADELRDRTLPAVGVEFDPRQSHALPRLDRLSQLVQLTARELILARQRESID